MKLIHCADIHLDAPMDSALPAEKADVRRGEILETFLALINHARQTNVRVVMVVGDLLDSVRVSATTQDVVYEAMKNAPDVDFLLVPGNHDAVSTALLGHHLSHNVKIFGPQWETVQYGGIAISSRTLPQISGSDQDQRDLCQGLHLDENLTNIVMLHGQLGAASGPYAIDAAQLRGRGIDYLALGHSHSFSKQKLDTRGTAVYSGCLEGRGFDECGPKGFVELNYENHVLSWEFVPFARRRFYTVAVGITNVDNVATMLAMAQEAAAQQNIPGDSLVRFELQGGYSADANKDLSYLEASLNRDFFFAKVVDKTRLVVDAADFEYDQSLRGAFVRTVLASNETEEEKQRIIQCGLRALRGEDVVL